MTTTHRLYLLRHAQACPSGPSDQARPLDGQGEADARALGRLMVERSIAPARAIVSDAARTRGTWACLADAGVASQLDVRQQLYNGSEDAYRSALAETGPADVMLIGHNPTIARLARTLAADGERSALEALARGFPTCGLAILRLEDGREGGYLEAFLIPPHPLR